MASLNERQKRFADFYIESGIVLDAAIKAGYSEKYANAQSYKLLENVGIKAYIAKKMGEKDKKRIADQDEILAFLTAVVRGEITEEVPLLAGNGFQELGNKDIAAKDRIKAAELLGKRYALFTDKKEIEANVGVMIVDDTGDDEE